ncbi:hypothetical protein QJV44_gp20 [Serratia phage vB_SmaS_Tlacuache]|uniref:Lambda-like tail fibre protein N-terminal domain-containing protein n=1 Tax=Serratia phage vB_SmaS_Tlacuache TaxID=2894809 RepID=A0AAE9CEI5_9CAUD|nr:hypothetical protein QJV44_gp20 [Serratia phage vB_SmaS_Tlacuache]UGO51434.1 hypothetical protein TLACUACHE_20 [Serratia phage vB_SmaS_Tlacuache]
MAVTISGTLKDGMQNILPNTELELRAKKTSAKVIVESVAHYYTSLQGTYNFPLEVGAYALYINFGSMGPQYVGDITVLVDSINGTLENFLTIPGEDEITPEILQQVLQARLDAQTAADQAKYWSEQAAAYASAASALSRLYKTQADAIAAIGRGEIPDGGLYTTVGAESEDLYDVWQNVGGTPTPVLDADGDQLSYPSTKAIKKVLEMVRRDPNSPDFLQLKNSKGYVAFLVAADYSIRSGSNIVISNTEIRNGIVSLAAGVINLQSYKMRYDSTLPVSLRINYKGGYYSDIVDSTGKVIGTTGDTPTPPETDDPYQIKARNAENMAKANQITSRKVMGIASLSSQINGIIMFGQSLSTGYEGWPAISTLWNERLNNLMLGNATRPNTRSGNSFVPVGTTQFTGLKAVVQRGSDPTHIMTAEEIAALSPGASEEGESPLVGAVNYLKWLYLQHWGLPKDDNMQLVASDCGVAGRTIEQLRQNHWLRFTQCVDAHKAEADRLGKTYSVAILYFMQGEWNYTTAYGGTTDKTIYKGLMKSLKDDMISYVKSVTGQEFDPAFIIYQTGAGYTNVDDQIKIGMAQLEFANEEPGVWCAGPVYQLTDKGGHLQPNGYRAYGMYLGYTGYLACVARLDSRATQPLKYTVYGKRVVIGDFLARDFPLRFEVAYDGVTAKDYITKGFKVVDSVGLVNLESVELVADTVLKITTSRDMVGAVSVVYAGKNDFNGNGNLTDSNPTTPMESYVYQEGTGQYPTTNIPELVNKPYSMHNWCLAHRIQAEVIQ